MAPAAGRPLLGGKELMFVACSRDLPGGRQEGSGIADMLAQLGCNVRAIADGPSPLEGIGLVMLLGNANWFPGMIRQLRALPKEERPRVVLWHWEPLPPPSASV